MKKISLVLLVALATFAACKKETAAVCDFQPDNSFAPQSEKDSLQRYLTANNIYNAVRDTSGLFYVIDAPGTGTVAPGPCSYITANYSGNLLSNGSSFTNGTIPGNFTLGGLIAGWRRGLPLIKTNGTITMYIPPSLAYGNNPRYNEAGVIVIPANSYLKFVVNIIEIQ